MGKILAVKHRDACVQRRKEVEAYVVPTDTGTVRLPFCFYSGKDPNGKASFGGQLLRPGETNSFNCSDSHI